MSSPRTGNNIKKVNHLDPTYVPQSGTNTPRESSLDQQQQQQQHDTPPRSTFPSPSPTFHPPASSTASAQNTSKTDAAPAVESSSFPSSAIAGTSSSPTKKKKVVVIDAKSPQPSKKEHFPSYGNNNTNDSGLLPPGASQDQGVPLTSISSGQFYNNNNDSSKKNISTAQEESSNNKNKPPQSSPSKSRNNSEKNPMNDSSTTNNNTHPLNTSNNTNTTITSTNNNNDFHFHSAANPRTLIPWNQRVPGDRSAVNNFAQSCGFCMAPHFWSRIESSLRHTLLAWLPIILILRNSEWRSILFEPFTVPLMTVFVGGNEFGESMTGLSTLFKSLFVGIILSLPFTITGEIDKSNPAMWVVYWVGFFIAIFLITYSTWQSWSSRFIVFVWSVFVVAHWFYPIEEGLDYYRLYLKDVGIGVGIALGPCLLPWPRFAMKKTQTFLPTMANSISILVQGVCASAWTPNSVEQRLDLVRLRQIRKHLRTEEVRIERGLGLAWWEPFSNTTIARARKRFELLKKLSVQMSSFVRLVDQIANQRQDILTADSTFVRFGELLKEDLKIILEVFDTTILRLSDCDNYITPEELAKFRQAEHSFLVALIRARAQVYYGENVATYKLGDVDLYFAHFFFFLEEILDRISKFEDVKEDEVPSRLVEFADAVVQTVVIPAKRLINLPWFYQNDDDYSAFKHSLKLCITMTIAAFLSYPIAINVTAPGIVALAHFSDSSFQYALQYLMGYLFGGLLSFISIQVAAGSYAIEVVFFELLIAFGQFVWTSENWISTAIAIILAVAGVLSDSDSNASSLVAVLSTLIAAIMCHLLVNSFLIFPQDPIRMLKNSIDDSMNTFRDGVCTLLVQLRPCHIDQAEARMFSEDARGRLAGIVSRQRQLLPAANAEPTMIGQRFPLPLYYRLIDAQDRMLDLLHNMSISFERLQSPADAPEGKKILHWVVVDVVTPACKELADLVSGFVDLIRLLMEEGTATVPISELVRISDEMKVLSRKVYNLRNDKMNSIRQKKYKRVTAIREIQYSRSQSMIVLPKLSSDGSLASSPAVASTNDLEAFADAIMKSKDEVGAVDQMDEEAEKKLEDEQADFDSSSSDDDKRRSSDDDDEEDEAENRAVENLLGEGSDENNGRGFPRAKSDDDVTSNLAGSKRGSGANTPLTEHERNYPSSAKHYHRKSSLPSVKIKKKKIDPMLGIDVDTIPAHALSTFIVATEGVTRILSEFLEAMLDIVNSDEISKTTM